MHDPYSYEEELALSTSQKRELMKRDGRLFHIIFAEQFDRPLLDTMCQLASRLREIGRSKTGTEYLHSLLLHKSAMLFFTQSSSRTFLSFVRACQYLGMSYAEVRDPSTSSIIKGESYIDSVRTFSSYFEMIIMRHHEANFAEKVAYLMNDIGRPIPVLNGGAGADQHPTQAVLDIYTLQRSFEKRAEGIDGIHVALVGDVKRGRTVRSLAQLLTRYNNVKMTFVSPPQLALHDDVRKWLQNAGAEFQETNDLKAVLPDVDAIYMTRIQDEYEDPSVKGGIDYSPFHLEISDMDRIKPTAVIMHPFPRRGEIDPRIDKDPRAMYWRQERNGMWIRAAMIAYVFGLDHRIDDYYKANYT